MTSCIIIRGNSGSGKSTLAQRLQQAIDKNTLLLPQDTLRRQLLNAKDGYKTPTLPLYLTLLEHAYQHRQVLIIEGILHADWYAPLWDKIAELYGENVYAYYYDLPFEETVKRHQTRDKANDFSVSDMQRWWLEKDYLNRFHETLFDQTISLDKALNTILKDAKIR